MFHGTHYIGEDIVASFIEEEAWRKVLGPIFIYLNSTSTLSDVHNLWIDAKKQVHSPTSSVFNFNVQIHFKNILT